MVSHNILKKYFEQLETGLKNKLESQVTARRKFVYEIARLGSRIFDND